MDKLSRYNQKLLAAIGTVALIILIFVLFSVVWKEVSRALRSTSNQIADITVDKPAQNKSGGQINLRDQQITFGEPHLLDTIMPLYIIEISLVNLENPEMIEDDLRMYMDSFDSHVGEGVYRRYYEEPINNLILYNQGNSTKQRIFDRKAFIPHYQFYQRDGSSYILINAVLEDTNDDELINGKDKLSFVLYNIDNNTLMVHEEMNKEYLGFKVLKNSDEVILSFGIDKNKNDRIELGREPVHLKSLSLKTGNIIDFVDEQMIKEIQSIID
ncbi:MAG: hypothetical protein NXI20_17025 [bacterium]|nr:hypothetical protein [bacterium]